MYFNLILWITIFNIINYVNTLRLSTLFVPSELIVPSETTWLNCTYDLENDHLYSIQWYKIIDGKAEEFYRYMPEQWPSVTIYEMPGIYIDEKLSKSGNVFLNKTDLNTEGIFRCEVSADSPSFQTVRKEAEMRVFQLPQIGPIIKQPAIDNQFKNHHQLLTCTALNSKPQTELNWFINDYPLSEFEEHGAKLINISTKLDQLTNSIKSTEMNNLNSNINHFNLNNYNQLENYLNDNHLNDNEFSTINNEHSKNGLSNSTSQLLLELNLIMSRLQFLNSLINNQNRPINQIKHLDNKINQLMITCKGQITNHLEQSTELRIMDTNSDQLLTVKDLNEEGPIISGIQNQYNKRTDQLQLNCTSTKSKSAAELIWLLNERPALEYKNTLVKHFRPIKLTDTEIVWRSSLNVGFDEQLFLNSNSNPNNVRRLKYDRKHLRIKCKTILDKTIDVGNAVHVIELDNLFGNSNELSKQLPARHNRSANIIWPIFTGEIVIGLFIVTMVICVIRSVCKE